MLDFENSKLKRLKTNDFKNKLKSTDFMQEIPLFFSVCFLLLAILNLNKFVYTHTIIYWISFEIVTLYSSCFIISFGLYLIISKKFKIVSNELENTYGINYIKSKKYKNKLKLKNNITNKVHKLSCSYKELLFYMLTTLGFLYVLINVNAYWLALIFLLTRILILYLLEFVLLDKVQI